VPRRGAPSSPTAASSAIALGLDVDVVIGDLDSASEDALAAAELAGRASSGTRSQRTPPT
jgi:thiamine pyrophosphokinase